MRLIGDVHGKYERYKKLIDGQGMSIQVGDMGVGFRRTQGYRAGEFFTNPPHQKMKDNQAFFIRGNHDNPAECKKHSQFIADGTVIDTTMLIGGGLSIDKHLRQEGYTWWADEQLSVGELNELVDKFISVRPRAMITHEPPAEIGDLLLGVLQVKGMGNPYEKLTSRTAQTLQSMWSAHSPELWVFGHWHLSFDHVLRGTRFVCLAELEYRDDLL